MSKIFISYRRQDSAGIAGRIYDRLCAHFGGDAVFMDIDNIPFGVDFRVHLNAAVGQCDAVLVVIGAKWAGETGAHRRLDDPRDFVRIEIESALQRDIPVIPILIDHARMPTEAELPPSLAQLTYRNAINVDQGRDFHPHVDRLVRGIEFHFQRATIAATRDSSQPQEAAATLSVAKEPERTGNASPTEVGQRSEPLPLRPGQESTNSIGMKLICIGDGEFLMGTSKQQVDRLIELFPDSSRDWFDDEQPQHAVKISRSFLLGIHPVTQDQYEAVMGNNPSHFKGSNDLPVENVSWIDAVIFCNKLSVMEGKAPFYRINGRIMLNADGSGYRLPTEAEWEYACRAGSTTLYPFGDDAGRLGEYAWYTGKSESKTHPVGQKKPNAWGIHDMLGNIWETCGDWHGEAYYATSPWSNPAGAPSASYRASRGGGWRSLPRLCRSASRYRFTPRMQSSVLGFRLALDQSGH